ncbi:MAG: hypothetical protein ABW003_26185 [Microvirga sp.]|jgi:hypothetical protein
MPVLSRLILICGLAVYHPAAALAQSLDTMPEALRRLFAFQRHAFLTRLGSLKRARSQWTAKASFGFALMRLASALAY